MVGEWFTTASNPKRHRTYYGDDGATGWKLHFVPNNSHKALCGLRAKHGWSADLFIIDQCFRCSEAADKIGVQITDHTEPHDHYVISDCNTHKTYFESADYEEVLSEARFATPHSMYYVTEWYGMNNGQDELIKQMSVEEWLHLQVGHTYA